MEPLPQFPRPEVVADAAAVQAIPVEVAQAPSWQRRLLVAGLLVGSALSISGPAHEATPAHAAVVAAASPSPSEFDASTLRGPCMPFPFPVAEAKRAAAEKCLPAMKSGKIALVNFSFSPREAQAIATGIEATLPKATNNILHVEVTPVQASPAAQLFFRRRLSAMGCVLVDNTTNMAANAADQTMPELRTQDMVVAITNEEACGGEAGGVADQDYNRHADVYTLSENTTDLRVIAATHEIGHLYRLGHAGIFFGAKNKDASPTDLGQNGYTAGKALNLKKYLTQGTYDAYAGGFLGGNVMGSGLHTADVKPSVIDDAMLQWPQTTLGQESPAITAGPDWTVLDKQDAKDGKFVTVKLYEPSPLAAGQGADQEKHAFDRLNIVSSGTEFEDGVSAHIVLSDSLNNLVSLGDIYLDHKKKATTMITYGRQKFELRLDNKTVAFRELTAPVPEVAPR